MYLDTGRIADLKLLEKKLEEATSPAEKAKYQGIIFNIRRQADHPQLNKKREQLLELRRKTVNATGEANIKRYRDEADKLEESIAKEIQA